MIEEAISQNPDVDIIDIVSQKQVIEENEENKVPVINDLIETIKLLTIEEEQSEPLQIQIDDDVYNRLLNREYSNENDDEIHHQYDLFSKEEKENERGFFVAPESFNVLDPNNYIMFELGKHQKPIFMARKTAANMRDKIASTLKDVYLPCVELWNIKNRQERARVKQGIQKIRDRMIRKDKEFRPVDKKKIEERVKPNYDHFYSIHSTNDGGIYIILYSLYYITNK